MVSFICNACGNTVKKNQVEKHYQTACRSCSVLSCIDCGVDFPGDSYASHTSCITEAEKYQGHLYQPKDKENKGEAKQKQWTQQLQEASRTVKDPKLKRLIETLSEYSNIPRKKKKFENFCKNSVRVYDAKTLDALWDAFNSNATNKKPESETISNGHTKPDETETEDDTKTETEVKKKKKKRKLDTENDDDEDKDLKKTKKKKKKHQNNTDDDENDDEEEEVKNETQGKFHWHKAIKTALKEADDNEISLKKLRKKVIAAYEEHGTDHRAKDIEESRTLFDKKLKSYPKAKIVKDKYVKFCT